MSRLGEGKARALIVSGVAATLGISAVPTIAWAAHEQRSTTPSAKPGEIGTVVGEDFRFVGVPKRTTATNQTLCLVNPAAKEEHEIVFNRLVTKKALKWTQKDVVTALRAANRRSQQPGGPAVEGTVDRSLGGNVVQALSPFHEIAADAGQTNCGEIKLDAGTTVRPDTPGTLGPGRYVYFCPIVAFPENGGVAHWEPGLEGGGMLGFITVKKDRSTVVTNGTSDRTRTDGHHGHGIR